MFQQFWKVNDMADMVKVEHLTKNFGDLEVLKDINLERCFSVIYHKNKYLPELARSFIEFCVMQYSSS